MSNFSYTQHRARLARRARSRKGLQMQRAESAYDTDGLSRDISNKPRDKSSNTLSQSIQAKLSISSPDDAYEKEADRTADTIVNTSESASFGSKLQKQEEELQAKTFLQRQEEEEEEELQAKSFLQKQEEDEKVQPKPLLQKQEAEEEAQASIQKKESSASRAVTPGTSSRLNSRKGQGKSMAKQTQNFMEAQFNKDFSGVRIHNDTEANVISQKLSAQAFTLGKDIYFNSGKYNPRSKDGKHLLAHELTHVVQQNHSLKKN